VTSWRNSADAVAMGTAADAACLSISA